LRGADYLEALLRVHRAFDESARGRLLSEDVAQFISHAPRFRPLEDEIARFFDASRQAFFGTDADAAMQSFPPARLNALLNRLVAAERET
jgi:mxaA protein